MTKKNTKLTYIPTSDHDEWLELRKKSIGGSDAATILGLNPFSSPYALWLEKKGESTEKPETEAMRQGTDLEGYVADRFCEVTGKKVRKRSRTVKNADYPFAHANLDRYVVGEDAGLECKTTSSLNLKKFENGEFPANYYIQCMHYLAITGFSKFYLAVLIFGRDFKVYEIERDEELIADLMQAEENFWYYVENDIAPPVDGTEPTDKAIKEQYRDEEDVEVDLSEISEDIAELLLLKEKRKVIDSDIKVLEQRIETGMGHATQGKTRKHDITWKSQTRRTFDSKRFINDHPNLDFGDYFRESKYRVLRVKEVNED